jgi:hypothetical protein
VASFFSSGPFLSLKNQIIKPVLTYKVAKSLVIILRPRGDQANPLNSVILEGNILEDI